MKLVCGPFQEDREVRERTTSNDILTYNLSCEVLHIKVELLARSSFIWSEDKLREGGNREGGVVRSGIGGRQRQKGRRRISS